MHHLLPQHALAQASEGGGSMKSGQRPREQLSTPLCSLSPSAGSSLAPRETRWLQAAAGCAAEAELDLLERQQPWAQDARSTGAKEVRGQCSHKPGSTTEWGRGGTKHKLPSPAGSRLMAQGLQAACDLLGRGPHLRDQPTPTQTEV